MCNSRKANYSGRQLKQQPKENLKALFHPSLGFLQVAMLLLELLGLSLSKLFFSATSPLGT